MLTRDERRRLAHELGESDAYLYQCLRGLRDMNPAHARELEQRTNGLLTRQMLCQKTWRAIWPELEEA